MYDRLRLRLTIVAAVAKSGFGSVAGLIWSSVGAYDLFRSEWLTQSQAQQTHSAIQLVGLLLGSRLLFAAATAALIAAVIEGACRVILDERRAADESRTKAVQEAIASLKSSGEPTDDQLRSQCTQMASDIAAFLADRQRDDTTWIPHWFHRPSNATEEQSRYAFEDRSAEHLSHDNETMARYQERYAVKALVLFETAAARGWVRDSERVSFEHPTNPHGIERACQILGVIGSGQQPSTREGWVII